MKRSARQRGLSLLDVLLIVAALAGVIVILLPRLMRPYQRSARISCVNNLKQVGLAFRIWAGDNNDKFPSQLSITNGGAMEWAEAGSAYSVFLVMSNELYTPKVLFCPEESNPQRRAANTFVSAPMIGNPAMVISFTTTNTLSYFAGLDGDETQSTAILTGDDHLLVGKTKPSPGLWLIPTNTPVAWVKGRHKGNGNLGMADGSVHQVTSQQLQSFFDQTGFATNRLAMP